MRLAVASAILAVTALTIAGCSPDEAPAAKETSPSASTSSSASVVAGEPGGCSAAAYTLDPAVAVAEIENAASLPAPTGNFGEKPEISFPDGVTPSTETQVIVLAQGSGEVVTSGSVLVANYVGQVWGVDVFDNSYDRGAPSAFPIGVGAVIPGWDKSLVGQAVGSRVMLVIPPADGYGSEGQAQAGIAGTDTLVFVIDIIEFCSPHALANGSATPGDPLPPTAPKVIGEPGSSPELLIGTADTPTAISTTIIATGEGEPVVAGSVLIQYVAQTWAGESAGSSWTDGSMPMIAPVIPGETGAVPMFDALVGVPVGSRVLIQDPGQSEGGELAVVVDIVSQTTVSG